MSNYPAGAEHDSSAPYNQPDNDGLCIYCDQEEIEAIAKSEARKIADMHNEAFVDQIFSEDDFYDVCLQDEMRVRNACKTCYLESRADDWEDDI